MHTTTVDLTSSHGNANFRLRLSSFNLVTAQGTEGGGHTGSVASSVLIPEIVDAVNGAVPVVAAGGIFDGRGTSKESTVYISSLYILKYYSVYELYTVAKYVHWGNR